ncbi:MAG: L-rhamnose isomerase, partial [Candidatus Brocadiia bacterium]
EKRYELLGEHLSRIGIEIDAVKEDVKQFEVEVPSWLFGEFGGGRFGDFMPPAPAPDRWAKIRDAAYVHELTGAAPRVAIHVGWDKPEDVPFEEVVAGDFVELEAFAREQGIGIGAVNPTLFLSGTQHGSLSSPNDKVRRQLIDHCKVCCEVAENCGTNLVTYWFPDGSLYPGQRDLWEQEKRLRRGLEEIYATADPGVLHLIEYKLFEPGTYSTIVSDAGVALDIARSLGERAGVLVDMGHHAWGVNVAQIVSRLLGMGVPGGFHFNTRYAADDDHAVEPNQRIFEIFCELSAAQAVVNDDEKKNWAYMVDQCSSLENRMRAVLHTIDSLMISFAKSLIVDGDQLRTMRENTDVIGANRTLLDAFLTDVRPIVQMARVEQGLPADPIDAFDRSGYQERIEKERS